ncbi:hypothetical protein Agub_g9969 [Astrephomene gubernaculifera]|uniref:Uncharacterized protein n=1 Tax=Astrephomene gubernaculifera TaxID=47775 RepID=A0AAD3DU46_9CHLO|nr:hypothetical protein Agub_g9969 [Astrephomene gubernaculifera]
MSLRRAAVLLAQGLSGSSATTLGAAATRLSAGASTSGRPWSSCLLQAARQETPMWFGAAPWRGTRGVHDAPGARPKSSFTATDMALYLGSAAVCMIGLSYASVPLYKMFCAATGFGTGVRAGHTVEEKLKKRLESPDVKVEKAAAAREIRVWFNADVSETMPWDFKPTQEYVRVKPGQSTLVFFTATNKSDKPVTGYSLYNVTPDKASFYFNKIQCFCFEEQRLRAGESIDMPVFFYIDPEFATDWNCRNVDDITLSYIFHKVEGEEEEEDDGRPTVVKLHAGPHPPAAQLPTGVAAAAAVAAEAPKPAAA